MTSAGAIGRVGAGGHPSPTQQSLLLAALVGAYANHFLARTMALKQARRMVSELIAKVALNRWVFNMSIMRG